MQYMYIANLRYYNNRDGMGFIFKYSQSRVFGTTASQFWLLLENQYCVFRLANRLLACAIKLYLTKINSN